MKKLLLLIILLTFVVILTASNYAVHSVVASKVWLELYKEFVKLHYLDGTLNTDEAFLAGVIQRD